MPVYDSGRAPAYLRTVTQLRGARLNLAPGQPVLAYVVTHFHTGRSRGREERALYDPGAAVRMRPLPGRVKLRQERARTCPGCGVVGPEAVRAGQCGPCREKAEAAARRLRERTCSGCGAVRRRPYPVVSVGWSKRGLCPACRTAEARRHRESLAAWVVSVTVCAGGCGARMGTKKAALAWRRANPTAWRVAKACPPCAERQEAERAERHRVVWERMEERRMKEQMNRERAVALLGGWAAEILDDPEVVALDLETTGLGDDARIVEIGVVTTDRRVLLNTLVNPGIPIPAEATRHHGITDAMVTAEGVPGFDQLMAELTGVLTLRRPRSGGGWEFGTRRIVGWNLVEFDRRVLRGELVGYYGRLGHPDPAASADAWLSTMAWEDVMVSCSEWYGEPSDYGGYRWQKLGGPHRAVGDCLAVLDRLSDVAGRPAGALPVQPSGDALAGAGEMSR
ncbi:3'-5' exonuclease [Kitasatospora xanthocidica]|uniref:3'-5' exonuclease n=1 Tax=Kitasatospora xanthocidica TaxID=83382 RepID=A0A372ZJI9_9ACTN|nr:3'-5' exonuclease [Kitasatospora xanthocidica]